jgi:DNA-directed RNA polymerase specialized sigma24 family protein
MAAEIPHTYGPFPQTRWSLVALAGRDEGQQAAALEEFLKRYLPALRSHLVHRRRLNRDEAEDLLQAFVCDKIIQGHLIAKAVQGRGRFRGFLRRTLDNYYFTELRRRHEPALPIDEHIDSGPVEEPSEAFDIPWAREVVREALDRMQEECQTSGRDDVWGVFDARLLAELDGQPPLPYDELVSRFHLKSPTHAMNLLITAKRMYERCLRAVVAEYTPDAAEVDNEIQQLSEILSQGSA